MFSGADLQNKATAENNSELLEEASVISLRGVTGRGPAPSQWALPFPFMWLVFNLGTSVL